MTTPGEKDVLAQNEDLKLKLKAAEDKNSADALSLTQSQERVTALEGENTNLKASNKAQADLVATANQAVKDVGAANESLKATNAEQAGQITTLKASQADFDKKLAAKLAEHGIRQKAVIPTQDAAGKKLSLDEQIKLARGQ